MPQKRKSDQTLADIDSMLQDYIPPAHLALVATPEEAEILGHDPHREVFDYPIEIHRPVTGNTWAMAQRDEYARYSRARDRSREVEQGLMYILNHELQRRFGSPVNATIYRTDTFTTYVDVSNGDLQVRYAMDDDLRYDILVFRPSRFWQNGSEIRLSSGMQHFIYNVYRRPPQQLDRFAPPTEFLPEAEPVRMTLDLTPVRISMEAAHQVRGYRLNLAILDEAARLGEPTAEQMDQLAEQFRQSVVRDTLAHVSLPQEEAPSRPSAPAPFIRSGVSGQRSPYGPPTHRRAR